MWEGDVHRLNLEKKLQRGGLRKPDFVGRTRYLTGGFRLGDVYTGARSCTYFFFFDKVDGESSATPTGHQVYLDRDPVLRSSTFLTKFSRMS